MKTFWEVLHFFAMRSSAAYVNNGALRKTHPPCEADAMILDLMNAEDSMYGWERACADGMVRIILLENPVSAHERENLDCIAATKPSIMVLKAKSTSRDARTLSRISGPCETSCARARDMPYDGCGCVCGFDMRRHIHPSS